MGSVVQDLDMKEKDTMHQTCSGIMAKTKESRFAWCGWGGAGGGKGQTVEG